ncbi:hypothetical protein DVR12_06175 [Chitinophaga silvatica]|uniref:Uncharacterized protein n=1 Tax=Chitinophaga silvatica TaxID=2282649 RepID=A0A3E1YE70_9BACT|nr:hypothetical protein [Chitinophaga silvatica]RFS24779.1 hypothetical protein DVR12_06175 [Chitinophaga silvatica]
MSDQQLIGLLEKYLQGNCTQEEKVSLESWYEGYRAKTIEHTEPNLQQLYNDIADRLKSESEWTEQPQ